MNKQDLIKLINDSGDIKDINAIAEFVKLSSNASQKPQTTITKVSEKMVSLVKTTNAFIDKHKRVAIKSDRSDSARLIHSLSVGLDAMAFNLLKDKKTTVISISTNSTGSFAHFLSQNDRIADSLSSNLKYLISRSKFSDIAAKTKEFEMFTEKVDEICASLEALNTEYIALGHGSQFDRKAKKEVKTKADKPEVDAKAAKEVKKKDVKEVKKKDVKEVKKDTPTIDIKLKTPVADTKAAKETISA